MFKNTKRTDLLFILLVSYVLVAWSWWSYLLFSKNKEAYKANKALVQAQSPEDTTQLAALHKEYYSQEAMIYGEGMVLLVIAIIGIFYIYSSRRKELALAQQQRNFMLSITHELKSPLASVKLALETLKRRPVSHDMVQKICTHAINDSDRLHKLVQDILMAARMETGYAYDQVMINWTDLVKRTIQSVQPKFKGTIKLDAPSELTNIEIKGDYTTLNSALLNLLDNAVKYAANTPTIHVSIQKHQNYLITEIADTGIGISKQEKIRIFDKFYRVGNEDTRKTKGTGLGLYIVKSAIKAHQGSVHIRDNEPKGSIFCIKLPIVTDKKEKGATILTTIKE